MRRFVKSLLVIMVPSKRRRDLLPKILVQGLVISLLLSTTHAQWLSFKSSRNPKSNLWFPNMPSPRTLQQRSSIGSSIRGLGSSSSSSSNNYNSGSGSNVNANTNNPTPETRPRSRPIGHRSVGQPTYQTVHGGVITRGESVVVHPRNQYQSSSLLDNGRQPDSSRGYSSSTRVQTPQSTFQQRSGQNSRNNQFSHRSGQQQSWVGKGSNNSPTVVTSKHLSINLNQPPRNKVNWQSNSGPQVPQGYASSKRLLEVGRSGQADVTPTRRPVTQIAGALQDSWPNSNAHHHLSPGLKNQKINDPSNRNNYYDNTASESGSNWGSQVRVSDQAIEIKNFAKPKSSVEQKSTFLNKPADSVDRQLSVGREKLVSNTLNTLAKLSPKKPIFVYMRVEGIAAINQGAEAGDVIKKLAGGSKLPFYNGTRSLPKQNMPQVFLAPEDMPPPTNYGKIPIPNLRPKEQSSKPSFTKILLPGGTRMTSQLSSQPQTTLPPPPVPSRFPFVHSTPQTNLHHAVSALNNSGNPLNNEALSLDQKIKILQMFQNQAEVALQQQNGPQPTIATHPTSGYHPTSHTEILRGVLPQGAILESISPMGGDDNLNAFSQFPVGEQLSNSIQGGQQFPTPTSLPNLNGNVAQTNIKDLLGSIIETAVSKTVGDMLPGGIQPGRVGHPPEQFVQHFGHQQAPYPYGQQFGHPQGPMQVAMINGQPMQVFPTSWIQPKMENGPATFVNGPNALQPTQPPMGGPRPRPHLGPTSPKPPRANNALKNALSFLGIQSTPRPDPSRTPGPGGPQQMPTQRPFPFHPQNHGPPNGFHNGPPSPTRMPYPQQRPGFAPRNDDEALINEPHDPSQRPPGQTIIVQTPDRSKPNGQKSTFVIAGNGGGDMPDLKKIMKVLNELNGEQDKGNPQNGLFQPQHPTRPPFFPSSTPAPPTRRPTMFPFNMGRPTMPPQQPQVMIRHPSGTPTPGPIVISTGRPDGMMVSSTFPPNGPTTPRPHFVSSTGAPMYIGPSPSSSPIQIIKAVSHPEFGQVQLQPQPQPSARPPTPPAPQHHQQQQQHIVFPSGPSIPMSTVTNLINSDNKKAPAPVQSVPNGATVTRIIEVDPGLSPEEIQKSIMDSIMKHQQQTNGGVSSGPIVINAPPSMASALGNSPHFLNVKPSQSPTPGSESSKVPYTVQPAIDLNPSTSEPKSVSPTSESRRPHSGESNKPSKIHHHSKEVYDDKPYRKYKSGESLEKTQKSDQSSEVIEKVITEEKIVWNPGPGDGEMIPSRIKTEERIILRPHGSKSTETKKTEDQQGPKGSSEDRLFKNAFNLKDTDEEPNKSDDKSIDSSNFAGLLRSKVKFEKMKQKLYPKKHVVKESTNPFSRYLHPSQAPTASSTFDSTPSASMSPDPTIQTFESTPLSENGRFKIRPGDISNTKDQYQGPVYGVSPSGQPVLLQQTSGYVASPSPSQSPSAFPVTGPSNISPSSPQYYGPSPSPPSYIGPSPSSFPYAQQSPSLSYPGLHPTIASEIRAMAPGTKEEKLIFIPADSLGNQGSGSGGSLVSPGPTIQTKNNQNQTVVFTTMNNLPDLMSQLSGTKTEVRMIDDMKTWQATLAKVQATQASSTVSSKTEAVTTPTPTIPTQSADRRIDGLNYDKPITWRPNGTIPSPTLESLRKRFPSGLGANVLHAVSAGFSANDMKTQWAQNMNSNGQQPQLIYTMANGVPVALNSVQGIQGYQPILLQGTKEPVLAYYGYNWNTHDQQLAMSSTVKPIDAVRAAEGDTGPTYTSRFRASVSSTPESEPEKGAKGPVYKNRKNKGSTTRDPIDPLSEEYDDSDDSKGKGNRKGQSDEEPPKSSRRRRPGAMKDESEEDKKSKESEESSEEVVAKTKKIRHPSPSVTPNILSKRIDESDEELEMEDKKPRVKVNQDMFVNSGEAVSKTQEDVTPTAKLPILLAPSIISRKSVVSKTGSSFTEKVQESPKPTSASVTQSTTPQKLSSVVTKILSTMAPTKPTLSAQSSKKPKDDDDTQELKTLLKKLQQRLSSRDDIYEDGGLYDYYDELQVPSTKATTTTTKGTKKPPTTKKSTKKPKKSKPKSKSKSKPKKNNKKSKDSKKSKTTKKPKVTTTSTTPKPVIITSSPIVTNPTTTQTVLKHNRHPVSSIESFTSPPTVSTTAKASSEAMSSQNGEKMSRESTSIEPQHYLQPQGSTEVPTDPPSSPDASTIAFVYPQSLEKDVAAAKTHYKRRPLWVRRKSSSGEGLESMGQPSGNNDGKVIRLVRRKRPGMRRRPVFMQQSFEVDQAPQTQQSTTATPSVDILFENNALGKRVGYPDSMERSQNQNLTQKIGGKRKLKLIKLKGQRAQWRLKMNDDQDSDDNLPQAAKLTSNQSVDAQLPQAAPLSTSPEESKVERQSRQDSSSGVPSTSVEAKVCIRGKCEMISKQ